MSALENSLALQMRAAKLPAWKPDSDDYRRAVRTLAQLGGQG